MSALLNIGVRSLMANQAVLQITGHNIANANTPGYSRQIVNLESVAGGRTVSGYMGQGVNVASVQRAHSSVLTVQTAAAKAEYAADAKRAEKLKQMEGSFPTGSASIGLAINSMLSGFADVAASPSDMTARYVALARASETANRLRGTSSQLSDLASGVRSELAEKVNVSNELIERIAKLNEEITRTQSDGHAPNDLLDQRDQFISQLNQYMQTSQLAADDGTLTLTAGNQILVMGSQAATLSLVTDPLDPSLNLLQLQRGADVIPFNDAAMSGGEIKGLLTFQKDDLAMGFNLLGRLTMATGLAVNQQHERGLTLDNAMGTALFSLPSEVSGISSSDTASGVLTFVNAADFKVASYEVRIDASGAGAVYSSAGGSPTTFTSLADLADKTIDGLKFDVEFDDDGTGPAVILFKPFADAAANISTVFSSPREMAAASQVQLSLGPTNTGTLSMNSLRVTSASDSFSDVTLEFNGAGQYVFRVDGNLLPASDPMSGLQTYTTGAAINYGGWELRLNGTPRSGDTATVAASNPAFVSSNAGNALALENLRDALLIDGGRLTDGYASLLSQVGVRVQSAQFTVAASEVIADSLATQNSNVSAVNLDEEAVRLMQFQQAYQASAKILQVAQRVFDTMLQELGR
jgi:flagellar hook-associated protein 1 FlgK